MQDYKIYNLQPDTSYIYKLNAANAWKPSKITGTGDYRIKTLSTFIENVSFDSRSSFLVSPRLWQYFHCFYLFSSQTITWGNVIHEGYARPQRYELRAFHAPLDEANLAVFEFCGNSDNNIKDWLKKLSPKPSDVNEDEYLMLMPSHTKTLFINELMDESPERKSLGSEYIYAETASDVAKFTFKNVSHFAHYFVTIRACYGNHINPDCSNPTLIFTKTSTDEDADEVENIKAEPDGSHVELKWDLPKNPNGPILYFIVTNNESTQPERCIMYREYIENGQKVIINDSQTDSITVSTRSVGSNWDLRPAAVKIKPKSRTRQDSTQDLRIIYLLFLVMVMVIFIMASYLFWQKRKMNQFNQKINRNYSVFVKTYEPDDNFEVARESVELSNEIGKGNFGKVFEGTLKTADGGIQSVAVKKVNEKASLEESTNFLNEASIMKQFDTIHIIQLLGIVSKTKPYLVVMELMVNGDLKTFLIENRPLGVHSDYTKFELHHIIPPASHMAIQIADGMAYLEKGKFIHRDLAARNCMVTADYTVKIGDFGLARDIHKSDYYRHGLNSVIPVRWMAPEFLSDGTFSSQSDVFSYGIVLWEILTYGDQPYKRLSNEQVINFVVKGGTEKKPKGKCPNNIFELMKRCWKFDPKERMSFIGIIDALIDEAPESFREFSFYCLRD